MALHWTSSIISKSVLYWGPSSSDMSHQCSAEGKDHLPHPHPAGSALPGAPPAAAGLCCKGTLLAHSQPTFTSPTRAFPAAALQAVSPQLELLQTIGLAQCFNLFGNKGIISVLHPLCVHYETVPQMNISLSALRTRQAKRRFQAAIGKDSLMVRKVK